MIDSESMVIDSIRSSSKDIYGVDNFCYQQESFGSLFSKARYESADLMEKARDKVRLLVEECDSLHGFIFSFGLSGGTGSGLTHLMEEFSE